MRNGFKLIGVICLLSIIIVGILLVKGKINDNHEEEILEIKIIIKNHKFEPDSIEVPTGKKIRLTVHNQDDMVEEFESNDLHREKIIMANDYITIILAPLAPGRYDFFGDFHQETAQGSLIVK